MPTGGAQGRIHGAYGEAATRTPDPKAEIYGAYAEAITQTPNPRVEIYSTYFEVMTTVAVTETAFIGWGIPM